MNEQTPESERLEHLLAKYGLLNLYEMDQAIRIIGNMVLNLHKGQWRDYDGL